jgi:hypothetical protein
LYKALTDTYEDKLWYPWLFDNQSTIWENKEIHGQFFIWLSDKIKDAPLTDQPTLLHDLITKYGQGLLKYYNGSMKEVLSKYNNTNGASPIVSHRAQMDLIGHQLGVKTLDDWHEVRVSDFIQHGGMALLQIYGFSMYNLLSAAYPEMGWTPSKFTHFGLHNPKNQRVLFDSIAKKMQLDNWETVRISDIKALGGGAVLKYYNGSLHRALSNIYPELNVNKLRAFRFLGGASKAQVQLLGEIQQLFAGHEVKMNYRDPEFTFFSNRSIELDIFIPSLSLAFEYQGTQHYHPHFLKGDPKEQQIRDQLKKQLCKDNGITLIQVPYWWDTRQSSLAATIHKYRPELFPAISQHNNPIPDHIPARIQMLQERQQVRDSLWYTT